MLAMTESHTYKRTLRGTVVSDKMQNTRVVVVTRTKRHPKYGRYYTVTARYKAHDEANAYHTGDKVTMEESRPLSRGKRWRIIGTI